MTSLDALLGREENGACADCGAPDPTWANYSLGVFICLDCSVIHRTLTEEQKLKPVKALDWEVSEVQFMAETGNKVTKAKYEATVPPYYYRPTQLDCAVLKEQWIRAKYERKEFTEAGKKLVYEEELRAGCLMKKGKEKEEFLKRKFVLDQKQATLKYYTKEDAKEPKNAMKVDSIKVSFQPEKIGHPNGLQISCTKGYRNFFLYHNDGQEIVNWFNAIRAVHFFYLKEVYLKAADENLVKKLTRTYQKEGFMEKKGPKASEGYKKRWFSLDQRRLVYYKNPMDALPKGEVYLGDKDCSYKVSSGLPTGIAASGGWQHGITLETPVRKYLFTCETEEDQRDWLKKLEKVINTTMSPQDYAREAQCNHKH